MNKLGLWKTVYQPTCKDITNPVLCIDKCHMSLNLAIFTHYCHVVMPPYYICLIIEYNITSNIGACTAAPAAAAAPSRFLPLTYTPNFSIISTATATFKTIVRKPSRFRIYP